MLLSAKNLKLKYPHQKAYALDDVSVSINKGRITQFLGKSGSGKTTLLKCFANLEKGYQGEITYQEEDINSLKPHERAQKIGYVSQSFDLFSHMNVLENCVHPQIHVLKRAKEEAKEIAYKELDHLGMREYLDRKAENLSGGQKQRVSIARALCMNSKLLLLDEPTSALDPNSSKKLEDILRKLNQVGITIVFSTHDMNFSKNLMDKIYFMDHGRVLEELDIKTNKLENTSIIKNYFMI